MPGGDRTGPGGMGPMTGWAAGYCAGYPMPGFANPIPGRGYGFGFGFRGGRGGRWAAPYVGYGYGVPYATPYAAAPTRQQEIEALQGQAEYFESALGEIKKRITELETEAPEE